jgi:hypothetical protein
VAVPGSVNQVRDCAGRCFDPVWHIENNLVAFADEAALWLYNIAASEPEVLLENTPYEEGMADVGQISIYSPIEWASNGRYLLLWEGLWEGAHAPCWMCLPRRLPSSPIRLTTTECSLQK